MNFKSLISNIGAISIAALSLYGCQDYDNGFTEKQIEFIRNFKEFYGEVDPTQDWNFAERANVTVTVSKPSDIQIFAKVDGRYRIVGDYKNVSGTRTLGFDVVEGTKDIMVSDGRTAQYTTVGGSAIFAGTRTIFDQTAVSKKTDDYSAPLDRKTYSAWRDIVPEKQFNLGKVVEDFVFVSTGKFTIYPIYWHTNNIPELGIYYLNENYNPDDESSNELVEIGVYKILYEDADSKINKDENGNALSYDGDKAEIQCLVDQTVYNDDGTSEIVRKWVNATYGSDSDGGMPYQINWDDMESAPYAIKSKGIEIDLPVGTVFGMFLIDKDGTHKFYSNSNRNERPGVTYSYTTEGDDGEMVDLESIVNDYSKGACHACAFMDNGHLYLSFEDWYYEGGYKKEGDYSNSKGEDGNGETGYSDFDMNDCIFMFGEDIPILVDYQAQTWILSAEDLGNTLDIDYNDVVIEVSHTSGRDEAYVTPLAAGGTLASFVYFTNSDGEEIPVGSGVIGSDGKEKTGEIHELFSNDYGTAANWISGKYSPINVWNEKPDISSKRTYTIKVDEDWSLATSVSDDEDFNKDNKAANMGGFKIKVVPENISVSNGFTGVATAEAQQIQNVVPGDEGARKENVPYVICTPKYWTREDETGHYRWPRESMPMLQMTEGGAAAYNTASHRFEDWVRDKTQATDWYKYPDPDNTTAPTGLGINPEASLQGSIGGGTGGISITTGQTFKVNGYDCTGSFIDLSKYTIPDGFNTGTITINWNEGWWSNLEYAYKDGTWLSVTADKTSNSVNITITKESLQDIINKGGFYIGIYGTENTLTVTSVTITASK